jgi:hypothetical protein
MSNLHEPDQSGNDVRQSLGCQTPEVHTPGDVYGDTSDDTARSAVDGLSEMLGL